MVLCGPRTWAALITTVAHHLSADHDWNISVVKFSERWMMRKVLAMWHSNYSIWVVSKMLKVGISQKTQNICIHCSYCHLCDRLSVKTNAVKFGLQVTTVKDNMCEQWACTIVIRAAYHVVHCAHNEHEDRTSCCLRDLESTVISFVLMKTVPSMAQNCAVDFDCMQLKWQLLSRLSVKTCSQQRMNRTELEFMTLCEQPQWNTCVEN